MVSDKVDKATHCIILIDIADMFCGQNTFCIKLLKSHSYV